MDQPMFLEVALTSWLGRMIVEATVDEPSTLEVLMKFIFFLHIMF